MPSFGERFHQIATEKPDAIALIWAAEDGRETQHTFKELDDRSTQLAKVLMHKGVGPNTNVAVRFKNSPEFVISCLAGWKAGGTVIPMRWDLPEWELKRVEEVANPAAVLAPENMELWKEAENESTEPFDFVLSPVAQGICSSGATGTPKVILQKVPAVWPPGARSTAIQESYGPLKTEDQRTIVGGPMYHTNGFTGLRDLLSGFSIITNERFKAERVVDLIEKYKPTGMVAATPLLQRIAQVENVRERDFSSMQWVIQGAAVLPPWVADTWFALVGAENMYLLYGSTEGAGVVCILGSEYQKHPGSLGKGIMGTSIKVLDADGNECAPREIGEIYMRPGSGVLTHEYLGNVSQTPVTSDGFTTIGDMGWMDEEGYLYIADRRVDMIKTGGANVFPAEVEVALSDHPDIVDVVVIGLNDPEWGKRVHAIVQPRDPANPPDPADLIAYAKSRLSPYKVPKTVEFLDRIPRSEAGKVSRGALITEREPAS